MSKELSPLDALKELRSFCEDSYYNEIYDKDYQIIETALKRLEELEKAFVALSKEDEKTKKFLSKEIEKNRAFEIIKEKRVDVQLLKDSKRLNDYNWCVHTKDRALTQEEIDLLKGVLL